MRLIASLVLFLLGLGCNGAVNGADTVYKSVGPDGKVVYGDRPAAGARVEKTMTFEHLPASALPASASSYVEQLRRMHARDAKDAANAVPAGVVLYSATWCGYCRQAKAWLASRGVAYQNVDIDSHEGAQAYAQAGGGNGIPLLLAGGRRVQGFAPDAYDAVFARKP